MAVCSPLAESKYEGESAASVAVSEAMLSPVFFRRGVLYSPLALEMFMSASFLCSCPPLFGSWPPGVVGLESKVYLSPLPSFVLAGIRAKGAPFLSYGKSLWREYGKSGSTAVTLFALAVLHAEIVMSSSIRLSLTRPPPLWTMKTSFSRTDSPTSTRVSPTLNLERWMFAGGMPRCVQMVSTRPGWEEPEKRTRLRTIVTAWEVMCEVGCCCTVDRGCSAE